MKISMFSFKSIDGTSFQLLLSPNRQVIAAIIGACHSWRNRLLLLFSFVVPIACFRVFVFTSQHQKVIVRLCKHATVRHMLKRVINIKNLSQYLFLFNSTTARIQFQTSIRHLPGIYWQLELIVDVADTNSSVTQI